MRFRFLISIILTLSITLVTVPSAYAATCRNMGGHSICISIIKRSAKYYWEYRAAISIDGQRQPIEIYNCRDRTKISKDRNVVPFADDGVGEFICGLFSK